MHRRTTGGRTVSDTDGINLPWFLTTSRSRGEFHSPRQRGGGHGYLSFTRRPRLRPYMASHGSRTPPSSTPSSAATTTMPTAPSSSAAASTMPTAPSSIPSSRVAGTVTPSSSSQAQHTPTQEAQVEGTDHVHVLIDDGASVGGKRKLKSDVWLEFEDVIVGGKKKLNASGVKSF
jgi:hypothetical protein